MGARGPKPLPSRRLRRHRIVLLLNDTELHRLRRSLGLGRRGRTRGVAERLRTALMRSEDGPRHG